MSLENAFLDHAAVLMIGIDRSGAIRSFNREAEELTGRSSADAIGARFVDVVSAEDLRERDAVALSDVMREPHATRSLSSVLVTASGRLREIAWRLSATGADGPSDVSVVAVGMDVTEQRQREARARDVERLAAVGTLASGLAHGIRNPLNGARLHLSVLERTLGKRGRGCESDAELVDAVDVVAVEIERLGALLTEFLDFARPRPIMPSQVPIAELCREVIEQASVAARASNVTMEIDLPEAKVELEGDRSMLEQALTNLAANAIEALAPEGGGHVVVRARKLPRHVVIEVDDDGPGIKRVGAPIYDAFYTTKDRGTGLGLAIAHRIATDHRGTIDMLRLDGHTIFRVTLPLTQANAV